MSYGMWRTPRSVCFSCRKVFAPHLHRGERFLFREYDRKCPDCGKLMVWKFDWRAPRRNDKKAWQRSIG
jgi:predicted RNA-binding Zn-ribbon protein involved in translation (DUF1610 family)